MDDRQKVIIKAHHEHFVTKGNNLAHIGCSQNVFLNFYLQNKIILLQKFEKIMKAFRGVENNILGVHIPL